MPKINYRLYASLLFMGLCPALYGALRIYFLGQMPDASAYSIAGQLGCELWLATGTGEGRRTVRLRVLRPKRRLHGDGGPDGQCSSGAGHILGGEQLYLELDAPAGNPAG